jgi:hypothetical protein
VWLTFRPHSAVVFPGWQSLFTSLQPSQLDAATQELPMQMKLGAAQFEALQLPLAVPRASFSRFWSEPPLHAHSASANAKAANERIRLDWSIDSSSPRGWR